MLSKTQINQIMSLGKHCSKCGTWKKFDKFYPDVRRRDGCRAECRECTKIGKSTRDRSDKDRKRDRDRYAEKRVEILADHAANWRHCRRCGTRYHRKRKHVCADVFLV